MNLELYCDGGSRGNPGKSACGFVVTKDEQVVASGGKYLGITTNNVAEWQGLIEGLKFIIEKYDILELNLEVKLDSKLVVEQINRRWQVKMPHLKPLFAEAETLKKQFPKISIGHVLRHKNQAADAIVNRILDEN